MSYRWTQHRVFDEQGNDKSGLAAISLWRVARAAAEETLQGAPLVAAWLKLFATQLSEFDTYWLRWRGDLAESAELRRAYSGLYGRFFARALLEHHLGLSSFISLKRNGISIPGSAMVVRTHRGDIPDWIAWDERNLRFVLGEAKGSLTGTDFLAGGGPKCIEAGKQQFERVETHVSGRVVEPGRWVAATRWATDERNGYPITVLWDPPVDKEPFSGEEAERHRTAIARAWLDSIAPGFGWQNADDLITGDRTDRIVLIHAPPEQDSPDATWPAAEQEADAPEYLNRSASQGRPPTLRASTLRTGELIHRRFVDDLGESILYHDRSILESPEKERVPHEGAYVAALITRFGIRPLRTTEEFEALQRAQERAQSLEEPAMIIGLPSDFSPATSPDANTWLSGAGIASAGRLALFDLRSVSVKPAGRLRSM